MEVGDFRPAVFNEVLSKGRSANPNSEILLWINFALDNILRYYVSAMPNSQSNCVTESGGKLDKLDASHHTHLPIDAHRGVSRC